MRRIIYDFGANNGDDTFYYLKKADLVVAVEANPSLCDAIRRRFAKEIRDKRLVVENVVLTDCAVEEDVFFYLHKTADVLGQFPEPADRESYDKIKLASSSVVE